MLIPLMLESKMILSRYKLKPLQSGQMITSNDGEKPLPRSPTCQAWFFRGMNARDKDINSWLEQSDIKVLIICGMGGSGKTTLAEYIVSSNRQHFEIISIVKDIGSIHQKQGNVDVLIQQFAKDIVGEGKHQISYDRYYTDRVLKRKKALIVFDDIDEPRSLEKFIRFENINEESKIIITTRNNNTHNWFRPRTWSCREYKMELLDDEEALELLSLHAFGFKIPMEGYEELTKEVLQYCEGNPLALEVLGSSLSMEISIKFWRSTLDSLKRDMNSGIQRVLKRSYDSLPNQYDKDLFLHIACFFVGEDKDYVENILELDYCASSGIKVLMNRCLLSVSPKNKLMMHQLIQEMGKSIIREESKRPAERSRVWLSNDSYKILHKGEGSKTMEGLALDIQLVEKPFLLVEKTFWWNVRQKLNLNSNNSSELKTDSLTKMDNLKLLQLDDVHLTGSYKDFSEDLRWLSWRRFRLTAIPSGLFQGNLVTIDMRDSKLEVFEPPIVLQFLKTLDLQGSISLSEIRNISRLPNLETLILCHCSQLVRGCESIGGLMKLTLLNMIGCKSICWNLNDVGRRLKASSSGGGSPQQTSVSLSHSLVWLSLRDCHLMCSEFCPLRFSVELKLQYLDLGGGSFESLPSYNHLKNLRILHLSSCFRLKQLLCLPSALAELYVYDCSFLERITFESCRFTLQELGYYGCWNLSEIEDFFKLVPIAKLVKTDLGHMVWLKRYENHEVYLVGDDVDVLITIHKSKRIQMLYEFGIMSTSLPYIKDPNIMPEFLSESPSLSFEVPSCPENRRLIGLNVSFKYTISDDDYWAWFVKIQTSNGVDYMYNPHVFGRPREGNFGIWLSFWPIGSKLVIGDKVDVSIVVISEMMEVQECGATLVYVDNGETLKNNTQQDLSAFQLTTGAFYLCRRDFYKLMEVGRLTPGWLSILVGDTIDDSEVRGWRKTGRPKPSFNQSRTELYPAFNPSPSSRTRLSDPSFTELKKF